MNKDKIKELKKKNGNAYVKNNDLLWYIVSRLDDLEKELSLEAKEVTKVKTQLKVIWLLIPLGVSLAAYIGTLI